MSLNRVHYNPSTDLLGEEMPRSTHTGAALAEFFSREDRVWLVVDNNWNHLYLRKIDAPERFLAIITELVDASVPFSNWTADLHADDSYAKYESDKASAFVIDVTDLLANVVASAKPLTHLSLPLSDMTRGIVPLHQLAHKCLCEQNFDALGSDVQVRTSQVCNDDLRSAESNKTQFKNIIKIVADYFHVELFS